MKGLIDAMDAFRNGLGALTLFVDDVEAVTIFYRDVLELRQVYEDDVSTVFELGSTLINLLSVTAATEVVAPHPVASVGDTARALLSVWVEDADATCAELVRRGVTLRNGPVDRPWGKRTAAFADPSGALWEVAQDLPPHSPDTPGLSS
jgi:catechol 2,3-dioxygenase-like lactoylglutathione lyase family enzyme